MQNISPAGFTSPNYYYPSLPGHPACMDKSACKMKVEGRGSIRVEPDIAEVTLGVSTENKQLKPAQEENAARVDGIIGTLRRMGVSAQDIATQAYVIEPQYDYIEGAQVFRGYRVLHSLNITIRNIARVGEIIDAAVESGANIVNNIRFTVSEPSVYYRQALRAAIDDAVAKAGTIGTKLRISVSQVPVQIIEREHQEIPPVQPMMLQTAGAATPIQPGQIEVTARIEAVFAYHPL